MKKIQYTFLAAALLLAACEKVPQDNTPSKANTSFPEEITATIIDADSESKTVYDSDGKFKWLADDQVRLIVAEDLGSYSRQGFYTYRVKSLSDEDKTAVFTSTASAGDLTAFVDGGWKSTGFAMYPTSMLDRFATPEAHSYGAPWFTLAQGGYVSGDIDDTILIGTLKDGDDNFKFYSAMSVLKITVNNIPEETACIKLCTADKTSYPVDGDFSISKDLEGVPVLSFLPTWVSGFNGYQAIDLSSESFIDSRDFYFNIPAASYPADVLSIVLEKSDGTALVTKTIKKKVNIARNECLTIPELNAFPFLITEHGFTPQLRYHKSTSQKLRFDVNTVALTPANYTSGDWENGNRFTDTSGSKNAGSYSIPVGNFSASGLYYLNYMVMNTDDTIPATGDLATAENVLSYGSVPIYFLKSDTEKNAITAVTVSSTETSTTYAGDNGGAAALWDEDLDTYWHTKYSDGPDVRDDVYGAYVDVTLKNAITTVFQLKYNVRPTGNGQRPYKFVFGYSTDGSTFTRIPGYVSTSAMQSAAAGALVTVPGVPVPASCEYIRIGVVESAQGIISSSSSGKYAAMAELEIYSN